MFWKEWYVYVLLVVMVMYEGILLCWWFDKCFYVLLFMLMDCYYDWWFNCLDDDLCVYM